MAKVILRQDAINGLSDFGITQRINGPKIKQTYIIQQLSLLVKKSEKTPILENNIME